jgi:hypothetical protein
MVARAILAYLKLLALSLESFPKKVHMNGHIIFIIRLVMQRNGMLSGHLVYKTHLSRAFPFPRASG